MTVESRVRILINITLLQIYVTSNCNLAACFSHRSPPGSGIPLINLYLWRRKKLLTVHALGVWGFPSKVLPGRNLESLLYR
jgi:hypothetical protein